MKLRNKKTGEIGKLSVYTDGHVSVDDVVNPWQENAIKSYNSLADLNEEWEDYEEPKKYWYITGEGDICRDDIKHSEWIEERKSIGNYFETEEEAERAVERLRAWKRLRDKGLRFERWGIGGEYGNTITFSDYIEYNDETRADLDLLFGGEE